TVARDGRLQLIQRSGKGSKLTRSAKLNVDELFQKPPRVPSVDPHHDRSLPAIFSVRPFPLLLSHPLVPANSWHVEGVGILSVAFEGRLLLWEDDKRGARQIADGLPQPRLCWADHHLREGALRFVVGNGFNLSLVTVSNNDWNCRITPLDIPRDQLVT